MCKGPFVSNVVKGRKNYTYRRVTSLHQISLAIMSEAKQPLLPSSSSSSLPFPHLQAVTSSQESEGDQLSEWAHHEYFHKPFRKPGTVEAHDEVNGEEIRAAAAHSSSSSTSASSQDPYPFWIYGALLTPPDSQASYEASGQPGAQEQAEDKHSAQILEEEEIREVLLDHIHHHCCWGEKPAKSWRIQKVEDCNSYLGTLETFIEERDVVDEVEPYSGGKIDSTDNGRIPGPWELDMSFEFPLLFVSRKDASVTLPHSEVVEKCQECNGQGEISCSLCNSKAEPGCYVPGVMNVCPDCHGRGLIAHYDGSDTYCRKCKGTGKLPCPVCSSRGLVKCQTCCGEGALLKRKILLVRWRTLLNRKVSASRNAATVPDDVFHRAKGVKLYQKQCYQCQPAYFPNSSVLSKFSADIIDGRAAIPPVARVICERHQILMVPVTRVVMARKDKPFTFYIIGLSREVYLKDYPAKYCYGLCCSGCMCSIC